MAAWWRLAAAVFTVTQLLSNGPLPSLLIFFHRAYFHLTPLTNFCFYSLNIKFLKSRKFYSLYSSLYHYNGSWHIREKFKHILNIWVVHYNCVAQRLKLGTLGWELHKMLFNFLKIFTSPSKKGTSLTWAPIPWVVNMQAGWPHGSFVTEGH